MPRKPPKEPLHLTRSEYIEQLTMLVDTTAAALVEAYHKIGELRDFTQFGTVIDPDGEKILLPKTMNEMISTLSIDGGNTMVTAGDFKRLLAFFNEAS